ncbi:MAG: histidine kinase [bacterium]
MSRLSVRSLRSWAWESIAVSAILAACAVANAIIVAARPAMTRTAIGNVSSALSIDSARLVRDLADWRRGMIDDGRWAAQLAALALDGSRASVDSLVLAQIPTARLWLVGRSGETHTYVGNDRPKPRHAWLAAQSLERDTTLVAVTEALTNDLRIGVASPMSGKYAGWTAVLDVSAAERLLRRIPRLSVAGKDARVALTFPFEGGFVGTTWLRNANAPMVSWPKGSWTLNDTSLVVRGGALPDTTPRFELGVPREAARAIAADRATQMHVITLLVAMPLCVLVLLIGRAGRNARLRDAERSLAESRLKTAQAEGAATRASLAAIQARLHPHFLSNALHSASALIGDDPDAAEETLDRLGDLFRYTLDCSERQTVRLAEEWKFVKDYLEIEQLRLGGRLRAEMRLDPSIGDCEVPAFVLQPLVENAIRHGIGPRRDGGTIRVAASATETRGDIELVVEDDGLGASADALHTTSGTGLRTLRERLAIETKWRGHVETTTTPGAGFTVRVRIACDGTGAGDGARVGPRDEALQKVN